MTEWERLCQVAYHRLYDNVSSGIRYSKADTLFWQKKSVSLTYGEMLFPSLVRLHHHIHRQADDVLLDCGSGLGKFAIGLFLLHSIRHIIGVEAVRPLHNTACAIKARFMQACPLWFEQGQLDFIHGNFLHMPADQVTIVYSCSTCFSEQLMLKMAAWLATLPKLHTVLTLKPLPVYPTLAYSGHFLVQCSWDTSLCHVYRRTTSG